MGLSHEWGDSQNFIGDSAVGVNTIYRQLLLNLRAYGSGPISLRIGGNSTDSRKEPNASTVRPFAEVAQATGAHFVLGVNLGSANVQLAADQAKAYVSQMPPSSVDAIEIGNEPDLYDKNGLRSSSYRSADYFADFDTWAAHIVPVLPSGVKLAGPAWTTIPFHSSWAWTDMPSNVQNFTAKKANVLGIFTQHYYASNPGAKNREDFLLSPSAATEGPAGAAVAIAAAHAHGIPFRMDEIGSIANSGVHGISDSFSAALWAVDTMFEYVNVGMDGINWEASDGNYDNPFYFDVSKSGGTTSYRLKSVNPFYYGLLFFQAATGNRARLLPINIGTRANFKAWATVDASGVHHVVLINKDEKATGMVAVNMPGYSHASVLRLEAPTYTSTTEASFAGQSIGPDGALHGAKTGETIAGTNGMFQIPIGITSAALVTFLK